MKPSNMILKSILIDNIYGYETDRVEINGRWWYAKPVFCGSLKRKIAWCLEILKGQAVAVHFKQDEIEAKRRRHR